MVYGRPSKESAKDGANHRQTLGTTYVVPSTWYPVRGTQYVHLPFAERMAFIRRNANSLAFRNPCFTVPPFPGHKKTGARPVFFGGYSMSVSCGSAADAGIRGSSPHNAGWFVRSARYGCCPTPGHRIHPTVCGRHCASG